MKISLEWLCDFLPTRPPGLDAPALGDALTMGGLPVEVIERHGQDDVLDVEVTSNRSDCLSHLGVARELAALLDLRFDAIPPASPKDRPWALAADQPAAPPATGTDKPGGSRPHMSQTGPQTGRQTGPQAGPVASVRAASGVASVRIEAPDLCPHYTARIIRGVRVGPSPVWMVRRLEAVGVRPINNIVDVTNYVLFELGQPLHAFDHARLAGGGVIVRRARGGETLRSIDGHDRKLDGGMLVIADHGRPVALAGVMGGLESEISEATTDVLLESARFDPLCIRKTARKLAMKSDSSYRFERGLDPTLARRASDRAAELILQTAGGELLDGMIEAGSGEVPPRPLTLRLPAMAKLLGVELPADDVTAALGRLGFSPTLNGEQIDCSVPSHRLDVGIEVDLIEEAARVIGYDKIPVRDAVSIRLQPQDLRRATTDRIRQTLVACGYFESITVSFATDATAGDFQPSDATGLLRVDPLVRKADGRLRASILPGLLESVRRNEAVAASGARLFEMGSTFYAAAGRPVEVRTLAVVGSEDRREVRGAVEALLHKLDPRAALSITPGAHTGLEDATAGSIAWGGRAIGYIGRVDAAVLQKIGLRSRPFVAELQLQPLLEGAQQVAQLAPLPRFPAIQRDLSLIVSDGVRYSALADLIAGLRLPDLEAVNYVTTYRGRPFDKGSKSLTLALAFRSENGTLTSDQVEPRVQKVIDAAAATLGATLRA